MVIKCQKWDEIVGAEELGLDKPEAAVGFVHEDEYDST
jgi:hypothetical protein